MENYKIIPRRFRPKRFSDVFGQDSTVATLKNALTQHRIGQAYLFCGARGCGKTSLARLFAKSLNCTQLTDGYEPCCACTSCVEIGEGRSLDVIEIDGASNRGIDDIRQINETVGYAPNRGNFKIYIIDEVHMLTKEAFNALLKTLEEPPKHIKFFFATTEPHKLPATIISRCQRFNLGRIPEKALMEKLKAICTQLNVIAEEEALLQISHLSEGSLRDAESMLDQIICSGQTPITLDLTRSIFGLLTQDLLSKLDEIIQTQNLDHAALLARQFYESGKDIGASIDSLLEHFRTHLIIQLGQPARGIYKKGMYTKEQCLMLLDKLIQWQQSMLKTPFKQIHLEMLLFDLTRSLHKVSLDALVQRLIDLEQKLKNPLIEREPEAAPKPVQAEVKIEEPKVIVAEAKPALFISSARILAEREASDVVTLDESIAEGTMDEERGSADGRFAAGQKPAQDMNKAVKTVQSNNQVPPGKYETLIRFAAVELEGSVK